MKILQTGAALFMAIVFLGAASITGHWVFLLLAVLKFLLFIGWAYMALADEGR